MSNRPVPERIYRETEKIKLQKLHNFVLFGDLRQLEFAAGRLWKCPFVTKIIQRSLESLCFLRTTLVSSYV